MENYLPIREKELKIINIAINNSAISLARLKNPLLEYKIIRTFLEPANPHLITLLFQKVGEIYHKEKDEAEEFDYQTYLTEMKFYSMNADQLSQTYNFQADALLMRMIDDCPIFSVLDKLNQLFAKYGDDTPTYMVHAEPVVDEEYSVAVQKFYISMDKILRKEAQTKKIMHLAQEVEKLIQAKGASFDINEDAPAEFKQELQYIEEVAKKFGIDPENDLTPVKIEVDDQVVGEVQMQTVTDSASTDQEANTTKDNTVVTDTTK